MRLPVLEDRQMITKPKLAKYNTGWERVMVHVLNMKKSFLIVVFLFSTTLESAKFLICMFYHLRYLLVLWSYPI